VGIDLAKAPFSVRVLDKTVMVARLF